MAWQATDYYQNPLVNLCGYIRAIVGTTIGVNLTSFNNFLTVGTNGSLWGWNNGLGFGGLGDVGSQGGNSYQWPFSVVVVNYYCNAADLLTIQLSQGISATDLYTTIPTLNGGAQITVPKLSGAQYTVTVPGIRTMLAQALADGVKVSFSLRDVP
jgi:hypothetical protein